jgi:UPF0755 protein
MKKRWFVIIPLLLGVVAFATAVYFYRLIQNWGEKPFGTAGDPVPVVIDKGTPARQIVRQLAEKNLISHEFRYLCWLKLNENSSGLQAGEYRIMTPITPAQLTAELGRGMFLQSLTIPEGWTSRQIGERLVAKGWLNDKEAWQAVVNSPAELAELDLNLPDGVEGFLFPDTYLLEKDIRVELLMQKMLSGFVGQWLKARPAERDARSEKMSIVEVVILASIVQREARVIDEMPRIASVFLNRVNKRMKLQSCATVHYALGGVWDRALLKVDLKLESPFNTYLHVGLPPRPISNPGREAIGAVLCPADTKDLYFVYNGDSRHVFSQTYAQHRKAKREAKRRQPKGIITGQGLDEDD